MATRRRKKRKKSGKLGKVLGWSFLALVVLCFLSAILGYRWVRGFLRSDDFRLLLGSEAGKVLDAEAQFTPFRWDGWSVSTDQLSAAGEGKLVSLEANDLEAGVDVGAVWDGVYRLEDILIREVKVKADFRKKKDSPDESDEPVDNIRSAGGESHFWDRFLPNQFEMTGLRLSSVDGSAITDAGEWRWADSAAEVKPGSSDGAYDLQITGGRIETPLELVPEATLQSARARYAGDHLYLTEAKFDALERARLELSGDVDFSRKSWNFRGKMEGADCEELVSPDWRQRLMGELGSDFRVEKKGAGEPVLSGSLKLTRGVLTALPVLDKIAAYTGALRFRRLVLSDARLDFRKIGERKELRNIVLASEGLVRVTGNIDLEGEEITMGKLRVGITPGTLAHLPGAETKVFLLHEKGLLWTTVNISGNIKKPREDLSERLIAAAGERMFELVPETGEVALRYSNKAVDVATRKLLAKEGILGELGAFYLEDGKKILQKGKKAAREAAEKGAQKAIEGGVKALEKGSGALFDLLGN